MVPTISRFGHHSTPRILRCASLITLPTPFLFWRTLQAAGTCRSSTRDPRWTPNIALLRSHWAPPALTVRPVTQDDGFGTYTHIPVRRIIAD
ncbi:hypothetical protein JMJ77_0011365 [Colletotrichum scovillei]|uniref:Uncharacterized protein n=1 Tax=Colletotrichum scovillei TaxID=1209932 RepID=A0A9P7R3E2_9PEZI|nr:hypothetical protein JMJ77_0011365 [Colletotrichum scovillei]KAG7060350.1 hypothetical protein JMJ78_0015625 [Colletotrichum scovillei]KAG7067794.1 hypothetical protein JMJ76_0009222 [Colletotrichum scovillei]